MFYQTPFITPLSSWRRCFRQVTRLSLIKVLLVCSVLFICSDNLTFAQIPQKVYVCKSPYASCFHFDKYCNGLNARKHPLSTISIDSIPYSLKACNLCVKESFKPRLNCESKQTKHSRAKTNTKKKTAKPKRISPLEDCVR